MLSNGTTVTVDMMNGKFTVPYYETREMKAVRLDYEDDASIVFIRPEGDADEFLDELTQDRFREITDGMASMETYLKIPKFDYKSGNELKEYLKEMGVVDAFGSSADFSQMTDATGLFVDDVIHECRINLDEERTEAAAVTRVIFMATSAPSVIQSREFYLDKPFIFAIMDDKTGTVLFPGKVENPDEQ